MASRRHFLRWAALGTLLGAVADRVVAQRDSPSELRLADPSPPERDQDAYGVQMKRYITAAALAQAPRLDG